MDRSEKCRMSQCVSRLRKKQSPVSVRQVRNGVWISQRKVDNTLNCRRYCMANPNMFLSSFA